MFNKDKMLITSNILQKCIEKYNNAKKDQQKAKENFSSGRSFRAGASMAFVTGVVLISLVFFVLELLLLFYSVYIALKCTSPGPERIMHVVLATVFTLPYALVTITFNNCAKDFLNRSSYSPS